jgi:hypothetical protein
MVKIKSEDKQNGDEVIEKDEKSIIKKILDSFKFKEKDYKCKVEVEETATRPIYERGRIVNRKIPTGRMIEVEKFRPDFIKKNGNEALAKCRYRAALAFGVSVDRVKEVYKLLNGKKIDGIYVTSLIDRYGFSEGPSGAINRVKLAQKFENKTSYSIDIAQQKLVEIMQAKDPLKGYMNTVNDIKTEFEADLKERTVYGE